MFGQPVERLCCPSCGGSEISTPYRTESVIYLACDCCSRVWVIETAVSEKPVERFSTRQEPRQRDKKLS
jgi:hypothetical protein